MIPIHIDKVICNIRSPCKSLGKKILSSSVLNAESIKNALRLAAQEITFSGEINRDKCVINLEAIPANQFDTLFTERLVQAFVDYLAREVASAHSQPATGRLEPQSAEVLNERDHNGENLYQLAVDCLQPATLQQRLQDTPPARLKQWLRLLLLHTQPQQEMLPTSWYSRVTASRLSMAAVWYLLNSQQGRGWLSQHTPAASQLTAWTEAIIQGEIPTGQVVQLLTGGQLSSSMSLAQPALPPLVATRWLLPLWQQNAVRHVIRKREGAECEQQITAYLHRCLQPLGKNAWSGNTGVNPGPRHFLQPLGKNAWSGNTGANPGPRHFLQPLGKNVWSGNTSANLGSRHFLQLLGKNVWSGNTSANLGSRHFLQLLGKNAWSGNTGANPGPRHFLQPLGKNAWSGNTGANPGPRHFLQPLGKNAWSGNTGANPGPRHFLQPLGKNAWSGNTGANPGPRHFLQPLGKNARPEREGTNTEPRHLLQQRGNPALPGDERGHLRQQDEYAASPGQHISNAGLLLLWPLLPQLFAQLELCEEQQFINDRARWQALYCLDWLVWGNLDSNDERLTLNQLLCGISLVAPLPTSTNLSEPQQQQIDDWLTAIGQQLPGWQTLSLADIRQLFLQRVGEISTEGGLPQILVKSQPYDYLLRDWPWPMTLASFPWSKQPLTVVWPINGLTG